jgi:hypothetical protein
MTRIEMIERSYAEVVYTYGSVCPRCVIESCDFCSKMPPFDQIKIILTFAEPIVKIVVKKHAPHVMRI